MLLIQLNVLRSVRILAFRNSHALASHSATTITFLARYQTSGQLYEQEEVSSSDGSPLRPDDPISQTSTPTTTATTTLSRPSVLQSLKIQANPISNQVTGKFGNCNNSNARGSKPPKRDKRFGSFDASKLKSLLRNGPTACQNNVASNHPNSNRPFPVPPKSTTQSNLQSTAEGGSSSARGGKAVVSPNLVEFFQKRLQEARRESDTTANANTIQGSSTSRPPPFRGPRRTLKLTGGLSAAMAEAQRAAPSISCKPPGRHPAVNDTLDSASEASPNYWSEKTEENAEMTSPLRQFILEMQKKNQQSANDEAAAVAARENSWQPVTDIPTWRKTARSENQRFCPDMVVPLFVQQQNRHHAHQEEQLRKESDGDLRYLNSLLSDFHEENERKVMNTSTAKVKEITLPWNDITVRELSYLLGEKVDKVMKCLEALGEPRIDDDAPGIDSDLAEMVALEMDLQIIRPKRRPTKTQVSDHEQLMERRKGNDLSIEASEKTDESAAKARPLSPRPPVVCIMGHVDHGKTTLMDALRRRSISGGKQSKKKKIKKDKKTKGAKKSPSGCGDVAGTEAGGITQVISAFQVPLADGQKDSITFLDTPGHAAFSAMRQSSSHAADILVLVIAADDGVSPQTIEILNFYKAVLKDSDGGISMVVAMNKIDKPGVDVEESRRRIENQLLEHGITPEGVASHDDNEFGSPVQFVPISAKTGQGLDDLIGSLYLQSEVMDLCADDSARAEGIVMDARVEQGIGVVADCIVRWGSIQQGDVILSGTNLGKVRALKDVNGNNIKKGTPSQPIRVVGFKSTPKAGDPMICVSSEEVANELVERRLAQLNKHLAASDPNAHFSQVIISGRESMTSTGTERRLERYDLSLDTLKLIRIPVIVKAKADGSVAAVRDSLKMLGKESSFDLDVDVIAEGVGPLTRSELEIAKESNAAVFCFNIQNQDKVVIAEAEAAEVKIHEYDVIYSLLDDAKGVFADYLPATPFETVHGRAKVQEVFSISGGKETVAGLKVLNGNMHRSAVKTDDSTAQVFFRVIRNGVRVSPEGETVRASSLKKFKEDAESVRYGEECGLSLTGIDNFKLDDIVECYSVEMKKSFV